MEEGTNQEPQSLESSPVESQPSSEIKSQPNIEKNPEGAGREKLLGSKPELSGKSPEPEKKEELKAYKAMMGDKELDVPADAKFKLATKAGKEADVSLEELKSAYWSKQENARLATDLAKQSKENKQAIDFANSIKQNLTGLHGADKVNYLMGQLSQLDPSLNKSLMEYNQRVYHEMSSLYQMSDMERERYFLQKENEQLKSKNQQDQERQTQQAIDHYSTGRQSEIIKRYKLEPSDLNQMGNQLIADLESSNALNSVSVEQMYNILEERISQKSHMDMAFQVFREVAPSKADAILAQQNIQDLNDPNVQDLLELYSIASSRPMSKEQLVKRAQSIHGQAVKEQEAMKKIQSHAKVSGTASLSKKEKQFENKPSSKDSNEQLKELRQKYGITGF